ncbi:MAG TPA: LPD29 domain-containing protein [Thermoleophilia bacterium]|nr:LPD29 domain-containing protein [Thermoleophilia bacterium]
MTATATLHKEYFTCAETARLVRKALKRDFPGVRFTVHSKTYAGGASVDVKWTDGPTTAEVKPLLDSFEGAGFDGMIDLKFYIQHYVRDGEILGTRSAGTVGNAGVYPAWDDGPFEGAELVHLGADFIFGERDYSPAFLERMIDETCDYWGIADKPAVTVSKYGGSAYIGQSDAALAIPANAGGRDNVAQLVRRHAQGVAA